MIYIPKTPLGLSLGLNKTSRLNLKIKIEIYKTKSIVSIIKLNPLHNMWFIILGVTRGIVKLVGKMLY